MLDTLQQMGDALSNFNQQFTSFRELSGYASRDWMMMHYDQEAVQAKGNTLGETMMASRHEVMRRVDEVTAFLHANNLPYVWKMYPSPAAGGLIKSANMFDAFIDVNLDLEERPKLIQVLDLLNKALIICERQLKELHENPPGVIADCLKRGGKAIAEIADWLFPSQLQRTILGWTIVISVLCLTLRYVFGFHFEELGKLVTKWVFK